MKVLLVKAPHKINEYGLAAQMQKLPCVKWLYIAGQDEAAREFGIHVYGEYTDIKDIAKLVSIACREKIQLVVVEPGNPVAQDILNACVTRGLLAFVGLCNAMPWLDPQKNISS